jgi:alkylhydroperoxidase family enzyme
MTRVEGKIEFRSSSDTTGKTQQIMAKLEESRNINAMIRLLANSPNGFRPFVMMSNALLTQAKLPPAVREVAVLCLARERNAAYQWDEHVEMSRRVGVTAAQQQAIKDGRRDDELIFDPGERLAMRIAARMARGEDLSAEDWRDMGRQWGIEASLDLVLTIAWWGGFVPLIINALRVQGLEATKCSPG